METEENLASSKEQSVEDLNRQLQEKIEMKDIVRQEVDEFPEQLAVIIVSARSQHIFID